MNYLVNFQPLQLAFSGQFSTGVNKDSQEDVEADFTLDNEKENLSQNTDEDENVV